MKVADRTDSDTPAPSDRAQAVNFLGELHRQVSLLDEDAAKQRRLLAHYERNSQRAQAQRVQHELRQAALERREVLNLIARLHARFKA